MVSGASDVGFTRQYAGTLPYLYPIEMQLRWGQGWPLGLLALVGFGWAGPRAGHRRSARAAGPGRAARPSRVAAARLRRVAVPRQLILLAWTVPYFVTTGGFYVKFMRYIQPLTPFLVLYGAALLLRLPRAAPAAAGAVLVVGVSALYALAFVGISIARPIPGWRPRSGSSTMYRPVPASTSSSGTNRCRPRWSSTAWTCAPPATAARS